jgi:glucose-1-phosphate adenylyltransferase
MDTNLLASLGNTLTVVLAGGEGKRLYPLTADRAKPAIPFGGKYRVIDFTLSNCLHSGLRRILVLTQYKSHSLHKHLRDGWSIFNPELGEYITTVPPQMRTGANWYQGTADAIYQNLYLVQRSGADKIIILAGDHIYRMDYAPMLRFHDEKNAALTIACMEVPKDSASQFGVLSLDNDAKITEFHEKPENPAASPTDPNISLVSMGVYVFSIKHLMEILEKDHQNTQSSHDFGNDIIPLMLENEPVFGYAFGGEGGRVSCDRYWRDVGTVDSYYQANMDLLQPVPPLNLYQKDWAIRSYSSQCPPARTAPGLLGNEGISINSICASGVVITGGGVQASILSNNVYIDEDTYVDSSLLFNEVRIGKGCQLKNCIIDKHVQVPDGTNIGHDPESDRARFHVSESGVIVVPKGYQF